MFSNTAFEAMYQYIGLQLHSSFINLITSQKVFLGIITMIFGILFFITTAQFFSRYLPGALVNRHPVPLSKYLRIVVLLFVGISILKVDTTSSVKNFNGVSWHDNAYLATHVKAPEPVYKVSFLFDLMSTTAQSVAGMISRVIEKAFQTTNSQLDAPDLFFKAIMLASLETIDSPELKKEIKFYTDECFDKVLAFAREGEVDSFFKKDSAFDRKLAEVNLDTPPQGPPLTCLEVKNQVNADLEEYARSRPGGNHAIDKYLTYNVSFNANSRANLAVSGLLVNEYNEQREGLLGVQKGSQVPGTMGRIFQYFQKLGFESVLSSLTDGELQDAWVTASKSQEFSENLARAPHVAGFIKMLLIAAFPWLVFFVIAGSWRVLYAWFLIYFSVLLWTPIWTLLYHIMVGISNSSEMLEAFGKLNDGVSLYAAKLITSRIYHLYAVYSWLQLLTGTLFTLSFLYFLRPVAGSTESDSNPATINQAMNTGQRAVSTGVSRLGAAESPAAGAAAAALIV